MCLLFVWTDPIFIFGCKNVSHHSCNGLFLASSVTRNLNLLTGLNIGGPTSSVVNFPLYYSVLHKWSSPQRVQKESLLHLSIQNMKNNKHTHHLLISINVFTHTIQFSETSKSVIWGFLFFLLHNFSPMAEQRLHVRV